MAAAELTDPAIPETEKDSQGVNNPIPRIKTIIIMGYLFTVFLELRLSDLRKWIVGRDTAQWPSWKNTKY